LKKNIIPHNGNVVTPHNGNIVMPHTNFTGAANCELKSGWRSSQFETCYKFFTDQKESWEGAQKVCEKYGGSLAILETVDELTNMTQLRTSSGMSYTVSL